MNLQVALAAIFFGAMGPMARTTGVGPASIVCITSLAVAMCHLHSDAVLQLACADRRPLRVDIAFAVAWLYAVTKICLAIAYVHLPSSTALPMFFLWVPLTELYEVWRGKHLELRDSVRMVCVVLGVLILATSDAALPDNRLRATAMVAVVMAAAATAVRMSLLRESTGLLTAQQKTAVQNSLVGAAAAAVMLVKPSLISAVPARALLLWVAYGLGLYVAYLSLFQGFEEANVANTAYSLLLELLTAVCFGVFILGEIRMAVFTNIAGVRLPLRKIAGLGLVTVATTLGAAA
uniref:Uncharacterized protein n=1 Tax=viral metagenome TaxID=1070528 RepID=A0A6C0KE09_9ZZZZ